MSYLLAMSARAGIVGGLLLVGASLANAAERQITHDADFNHELDNNDNFSPDDRFLVFDARTADGGIAVSRLIAKVEIATGRIVMIDYPDRDGDGIPDPVRSQR